MPEIADNIRLVASSDTEFSPTYPRSPAAVLEAPSKELTLDEEQIATGGDSPEMCGEESYDDEDFGLIVSEAPGSQPIADFMPMEEASIHQTDVIDPLTSLLDAHTPTDSSDSQFLHDPFKPDWCMPAKNNPLQQRDLNAHETPFYSVPVYDTRGYLCQINPQTYHSIHSEVMTEDIHSINHREPLTGPVRLSQSSSSQSHVPYPQRATQDPSSFAQRLPGQYLSPTHLASTPLFTTAPLFPRSAKHNPVASSATLAENSALPRPSPPQESFPTPRANWWYHLAQLNPGSNQPTPSEAVLVNETKWKWLCPGRCGKSYTSKITLKRHLNSGKNTCERPTGYTAC